MPGVHGREASACASILEAREPSPTAAIAGPVAAGSSMSMQSNRYESDTAYDRRCALGLMPAILRKARLKFAESV